MKKTMMIAAGLMISGAALAQNPYDDNVVREQGIIETTDVAGTDYPPCDPGYGDDNCIQLYERGVRAALASYSPSNTAMGGPYEAVAHSETMTHSSEMSAMHTNMTGMGGPIDERTGYPPCDPGPGDDNCIQLYERGVTGAGN